MLWDARLISTGLRREGAWSAGPRLPRLPGLSYLPRPCWVGPGAEGDPRWLRGLRAPLCASWQGPDGIALEKGGPAWPRVRCSSRPRGSNHEQNRHQAWPSQMEGGVHLLTLGRGSTWSPHGSCLKRPHLWKWQGEGRPVAQEVP